MSAPDLNSLTVATAHQRLKQFDCLHHTDLHHQDLESIRQALLRVAQQSDYQILGVCADSLEQGQQALQSYAKALGYQPQLVSNPIAGVVYLKFNPKSGLCYADSYSGVHRGVLVACQSADSDGINEMYGHLPLNLFTETLTEIDSAG